VRILGSFGRRIPRSTGESSTTTATYSSFAAIEAGNKRAAGKLNWRPAPAFIVAGQARIREKVLALLLRSRLLDVILRLFPDAIPPTSEVDP
jgi:hypothetical protein